MKGQISSPFRFRLGQKEVQPCFLAEIVDHPRAFMCILPLELPPLVKLKERSCLLDCPTAFGGFPPLYERLCCARNTSSQS